MGASDDRTEPLRLQVLAIDLELVESIDVESGLSEWEVEFVDSVLRQVRSENKTLSPKQRATAQRIQKKLDGGA